jgi:hypothetical protein
LGPRPETWLRCLVAALALQAAGASDRSELLAALAKEGSSASDRVALVARLLPFELQPAHLESMAKAFPERDRRELVALLEKTLRAPAATPGEWGNAARLAALAPDPALAAALLDRLQAELAGDSAKTGELVAALRAAIDASRRRVAELEAERLAQASAETCVAQLEALAPEVRRAALRRLLELAQRRADAPEVGDEPLQRARDRAFRRLAAAAPEAVPPAPLAAEELRLFAELAAELAPKDADAKRRWLEWLAHARDGDTRLALLAALRRLARGEQDEEIAAAVARLCGEELARLAAAPGTDGEGTAVAEAAVELLGAAGGAAALDALAPCLAAEGAGRAELRRRAVAAAADLGSRASDPSTTRRAIDLLAKALDQDAAGEVKVAAALGLARGIEAIADRPKPAAPAAAPATALDAETLVRAFDALRTALPKVGSDRALAEQCCKALCRVPGRGGDAARVMADALAATTTPIVREALLRGLKELGDPAGIPAIVGALTKGGPSVEPDALGKEAYAALLAVLRRAQEGGRGVAAELEVASACLAAGEAEWALHYAGHLLDEIERSDHDLERAAIRLAYGRAALKLRLPETLEKAWQALNAAADDVAAEPARRAEALGLLLELAEKTRPLHAREAASRAEQLLQGSELAADARLEVVRRGALLWLAAGQWERSYALLDREVDEGAAPTEILVLKARAAARREDAGAGRDALRLHELLVGSRGAGGKLAADAADRPALVLALAHLYAAGARADDARAALRTLPPADSLAPDLRDDARELERSLSG